MADEALLRRLEYLESEVRALRAFEHAPYQAIIEDMSELVVRWRPDGTRVFVNDAYCRLFGASREDLIGTSFWPLISAKDRAQVEERISRLSPATPISIGRHRALGPDGCEFYMEWVDRALFDEKWNVAEYQSVGRDISERVRLQEHMRRVEQADAVARSSAGIAHDLANMMVVIKAQVDSIQNDPSVHDLDAAVIAVDRANALVRELQNLTYGRAPQRIHFDLNQRIQDNLGLLKELAGRQLRFETRLSSEPCSILGDPTQIDQVLLNLVRNASEASSGATNIELVTQTTAADSLGRGHQWRGRSTRCHLLRVTDDAGGIPPEVLARVFEPGVTTRGEGRGLGLATVQAIARSHGGSVQVENTNGGTCFEIGFPVAEKPAFDMGQPA